MAPGSTITYAFVAANSGTATATATGVVVTLPTPANTTFVAGSAIDSTGAALPSATNPFAAGWPLPDLAPGQSATLRFTVRVDSPLPDGTPVDLAGTLDADQLTTPMAAGTNHLVSSTMFLVVGIEPLPPATSLVAPGSTILYQVSVSNSPLSTGPATGVVLTADTPLGAAFVANSAVDEAGTTVTGTTNPFATGWPLPDLAPGNTLIVQFEVVVDSTIPAGTLVRQTSQAMASELTFPVVTDVAHEVDASLEVDFRVDPFPLGGTAVVPGNAVAYAATVKNLGTSNPLTGLFVTLPTPADTTYLANSAFDETGATISGGSNPFEGGRALPDLAPGASWTVGFEVVVDRPLPDGTTITHLGSLSAAELGSALTDAVSHPVTSSPDLSIAVVPDPPEAENVRPGLAITYDLVVSNAASATETATGLVATMGTPLDTTYDAGSALDETGGTIAGGTNPFAGGWPLPDLAPGDSHTIQITTEVDAGVTDGSIIRQLGELGATQLGASTIQDTAAHQVVVYENSPLQDVVVISEVNHVELGPLLADNDEAIELRNLGGAPVDVSGFTVADLDVLGLGTDTASGSVSFEIPGGTVLPAYGHLVIWLGTDQSGTNPGFTDIVASATPQLYANSTPVLDNAGDDLWMYDPDLKVVDRVAWGAGSDIQPAPPSTIAPWDPSNQAALGSLAARLSIASTPSTSPSRSSNCWEPTLSGTAPGDATCPTPLVTRQTDPWPGRSTSLGEANTIESPRRTLVAITEVLYAESGLGLLGNDEAIEITNLGPDPLDLSGWTLADGDVATGYAEAASFSHTFPLGSVLPAGGIAVVWVGVDQTISLPGFTNVGADLEQYVGVLPALTSGDDDLWLFDPGLLVADVVGWGPVGLARSTPPVGLWDTTFDATIAGAISGRSIAATPSGTNVDTSACWELTASDAANGDPIGCPVTPATLDLDAYAVRVTSLGRRND